MKISSMTPFSITTPNNGNVKSTLKFAQSSNTAVDSNRRFDTFTMTGVEGKKDGDHNAKMLDEKTAELVRSLSLMCKDDETELAFAAYVDMQRALGCMKELTEDGISYFTELTEKKVYYNSLLDSQCFVGEGGGQYRFSDYAEGEHVDRSKVTAQLDKVQKCIDSMCGNYAEEKPSSEPLPPHVLGYITYDDLYEAAESLFKCASQDFCGVTGISNSALEMEKGEFHFDTEGVTEENFLEKANDLLNSINERSEKLKDVMTEYLYSKNHKLDKLQTRLELAEERQADKEAVIEKMTEKYDKLLLDIDSDVEIKA